MVDRCNCDILFYDHVEFIHLMWLFVVVFTKVVLDILLLMSSSPKRPLCGSIYCLDISWFNFQQFFIKRVYIHTGVQHDLHIVSCSFRLTVTRNVSLVEQELITLPGNLNSTSISSGFLLFNLWPSVQCSIASSSIRWFKRSVPWCYKRRPWMRNQWMSTQWMHTSNECVINECVMRECVINGSVINECIINEWVINEEKKSRLLKYTIPIKYSFIDYAFKVDVCNIKVLTFWINVCWRRRGGHSWLTEN
jgi:hypothetical protein